MSKEDPDFVTQYEQDTWERCASTYVDGFGALVGESIPTVLDAANVTAGTRVLDIGTGPGLVAAAATERGGVATGIDFAESMVNEARTRYPKIEFRQGNAEALPFADAAFDAVVGNFVLHHLARPDKVLGEARRVLRQGGKAAFTVWQSVRESARALAPEGNLTLANPAILLCGCR